MVCSSWRAQVGSLCCLSYSSNWMSKATGPKDLLIFPILWVGLFPPLLFFPDCFTVYCWATFCLMLGHCTTTDTWHSVVIELLGFCTQAKGLLGCSNTYHISSYIFTKLHKLAWDVSGREMRISDFNGCIFVLGFLVFFPLRALE